MQTSIEIGTKFVDGMFVSDYKVIVFEGVVYISDKNGNCLPLHENETDLLTVKRILIWISEHQNGD